MLDHPEVTSATIGPDKREHVDEVLGALSCTLTAEERTRLDAASEVKGPVKFA